MKINSPLFQIAEQCSSAKVAETEKFFFTNNPCRTCNVGWHGKGKDFPGIVVRVSCHIILSPRGFGFDSRAAINLAFFFPSSVPLSRQTKQTAGALNELRPGFGFGGRSSL
jgi:hypothetical protein